MTTNLSTYKVGISLRGDLDVAKKYKIKIFQLMTQDTSDGSIIWKPKDIEKLRNIEGVKLYSHAMFKIVLGRYFPTVKLFCEHYKYLCEMGFDGYVIHIPANIEMDYCVEFVKKMFKLAKAEIGGLKPVRVYFEHVPSEMYSLSANMVKLANKLKSANLALPIGLCIDTCHMYVSGVSPVSRLAMTSYIADIESAGLPYIIHLNDSVGDESTFVDRHDTLGNKIWKDDKSGLSYIKSLSCDKIIELADPEPSLALLCSVVL